MAVKRIKKDQQLTVPGLKVQKNIISYGDSFICAKNVSLISISPIPANGSWIIAILLALAGLYMFLEYGSEFGGGMIVVGAVWLIVVILINCNRGINLAVNLNSGKTLYFHCSDEQFLRKVLQVLLACINNIEQASCYINFENCSIQNSEILNDATITR